MTIESFFLFISDRKCHIENIWDLRCGKYVPIDVWVVTAVLHFNHFLIYALENKISVFSIILNLSASSRFIFFFIKIHKNKFIRDLKNRTDKNNESNKTHTSGDIFFTDLIKCFYDLLTSKILSLQSHRHFSFDQSNTYFNAKSMLKIFDSFFCYVFTLSITKISTCWIDIYIQLYAYIYTYLHVA